MIEILEKGRKPTWCRNRFADRVIEPLHELALEQSGLNFFAEDWDDLIIFDACRADLFEDTLDISQFDSYRRVRSPGSATSEWCQETLAGGAFIDTVYVTANPSVTKHANATFAVYKDLSKTHFDRDIGTVPPEPVTD